MRNRHIPTLAFLVLINFICFSQNSMNENPRVKKLKESTKFENGEISIIAKVIDSTENINIFLINRTTDTLKIFGGYNAEILFNKEIKDIDSIWKPFDALSELAYWCGTGLQTISLPKDSYTYEIYNKSVYTGELNTEIRFSFRVKDSLVIYSKPISIKANNDLLLKPSDRIEKYIYKELKENNTLNYSQKEKLILKISSIHSKERNYKKSILICEKWLKNNPNSIRLKYELAVSIFKYISQHKSELNKVQINILLSKAINELKTIPKSDNLISIKSTKYIDNYSKLLLSKSEWNQLKKEECTTENDTCYFRELSDEKIGILYKN
ncbi:hypothetical protein ACFQ1R_11360 [Mariniflexile jejuense]|uniref:Tetratricopeptide repeat protein n=2 Tax=Mariniflexile jejuense TaxID=1173582 RepID=A0ABW3JMC0_9FLAO